MGSPARPDFDLPEFPQGGRPMGIQMGAPPKVHCVPVRSGARLLNETASDCKPGRHFLWVRATIYCLGI